ncbi:G-D-S-L family lipolytic protein [Calothrix sp. NIES-4071]|nr:G-D-S-L family lipolytic protein [Calothrix sp. NIES-4071]BAZ54549.1 G-D-S-L family lipolytic protein [Calothrix sp. NIES-4105]
MESSTVFSSDNTYLSVSSPNTFIAPEIYPNTIQDSTNLMKGSSNSLLFTVNSTADVVNSSDGVTTLREAINQANALRGNDTIVFDQSLFQNWQTITLSLGQLDITDNLTIKGGTDGQTVIINGNNASRIFQINSGATVNLSGLMITNGVTNSDGGAIYNAGNLTISDTTIINNSAHRGGGIFNTATLNITSSGISGNKANDGGGIFNDGYFGAANLTASYTYIGGNSANQSGGGVGNFNGGVFNYSYGSISDNSAFAGGGIFNAQGTVQIDYSTLKDNTGIGDSGGVINNGTFNVSNSTLIGGNSSFTPNPNPNPNPISNTPIKIMPLGDSITQGFVGQDSYRRPLWFDLKNAGYNVDFIGSVRWTTEGITPPTPDFDLDNEGHGGWTSDQLLDNVDEFASSNRPDVVLLHIGTNDLNIDRSPESIINNIGGIIQKLRNENQNVKVLLAQIIPDGSPDRSAPLNALIPGLAASISTTQSPVIVVDQYTGFNLSDTLDTFHPNSTGEWKMATRWFDTLKTVL